MDDDALADDLDRWLIGDEIADDVPTEHLSAFTPADDAHADRLLRARDRHMREEGRVRKLAKQRRDEITAWENDRAAGPMNRAAELERLLEGYMRARHASDPRVKTLTLPAGTLKLSAPDARIVVTDERALRSWLWSNRPDMLDIKVTPKAGEVKRHAATSADPKQRVKQEAERPFRLGPPSAPDAAGEVTWPLVADGGEVVPGVVICRDSQDKFTAP